jgi:hypothetical protein
MRYFIITFLFAVAASVLLFLPHLASAGAQVGSASSAPGTPSDTLSIVEDQEAGLFRFMIGEKEVARLGADGLHVEGNISYGGTITDVGPSAVQGGAE